MKAVDCSSILKKELKQAHTAYEGHAIRAVLFVLKTTTTTLTQAQYLPRDFECFVLCPRRANSPNQQSVLLETMSMAGGVTRGKRSLGTIKIRGRRNIGSRTKNEREQVPSNCFGGALGSILDSCLYRGSNGRLRTPSTDRRRPIDFDCRRRRTTMERCDHDDVLSLLIFRSFHE